MWGGGGFRQILPIITCWNLHWLQGDIRLQSKLLRQGKIEEGLGAQEKREKVTRDGVAGMGSLEGWGQGQERGTGSGRIMCRTCLTRLI